MSKTGEEISAQTTFARFKHLGRGSTQAAGIEAIKPVLLWLYEPANGVRAEIADSALQWLQSWIMRRSLLRRSASDLSRTVAQLITELRALMPEQVAERSKEFLAGLSRPGTYWPSDRELRAELQQLPMYTTHSRSRLRMFLETFEDDASGYTTERQSRTRLGFRAAQCTSSMRCRSVGATTGQFPTCKPKWTAKTSCTFSET